MNYEKQEVSEENDIMWPRDWLCDFFFEEMIAFCPCLKNLSVAKLSSIGLTCLAEKILKQLSLDTVL